MLRVAAIAATVIATVANVSICRSADLAGEATVIDGDTIEINGQQIMLFGIDAPESDQICKYAGEAYHCGQQSALALKRYIGTHAVTCDARSWSYEHVLAVCMADDDDLSRLMVLNGQAFADRPGSSDYTTDEADAQTTKRGIWRGEFVMPAAWRQGVR
jgi:endonuclease YncB( thermonuclease family)